MCKRIYSTESKYNDKYLYFLAFIRTALIIYSVHKLKNCAEDEENKASHLNKLVEKYPQFLELASTSIICSWIW